MTSFSRTFLLFSTVLVLVTACRPAARDQAATPATSPASSTSASSQPASSPPAGSTPPGTAASSATPTPRPASSTPAGTATAGPVDGPGGCPTAALAIEALRGSGAAGHQYAFLQFTNRSAKTCSLTGYPGVQLVRAGAPLGKPAVRSGKPVRRVQIAPGRSVTAQLVDASTCNAEISDSVAIYPPNRTERVVVRLALRGCPLTVDPVAAG